MNHKVEAINLKGCLIGLCGLYCSGKGAFIEIMKKFGWKALSLSDVLREELKERGKDITRENLIEIGNQLRMNYGPSILAQMTISLIQKEDDYLNKNFVIDSIRHPAEVEAFRKNFPNFHLVEVVADARIRFKRMLLRNRENDPKTFSEMMRLEKLEQSSDPDKQQLHNVIKMADFRILNNNTLADLEKRIPKLLYDIANKRPSWDEYFMRIMEAVSLRATCDRGKAGAVIVKDKKILTTGYVGSPQGLPHCAEAGHLIERRLNPDGSVSEHCIRTAHAEQNAIVQAAKHGVSIDGATLYCRMEPCRDCARMIINAGIKRVVVQKRYQKGELTRQWFKEAGVELVVLKDEIQKY